MRPDNEYRFDEWRLFRRPPERRKTWLKVTARAQERKIDVGRGVNAAAVLVIGLALAAAVATFGVRWAVRLCVTDNDIFLIKHLDVASVAAGGGDGILGSGDLLAQTQVRPGQNLFSCDLRRLRADLLGMPLVSNAVVTLKLPDTLTIRVQERTAVARVRNNADGQVFLVDGEGRLLLPDRAGSPLARRAHADSLPLITGFRQRAARPGDLAGHPLLGLTLQLCQFADNGRVGPRARIRSIDVTNMDYMNVELDSGTHAWISRERWDEKWLQLGTVLASAAQQGRQVALINMTVSRNYPIQYQPQ